MTEDSTPPPLGDLITTETRPLTDAARTALERLASEEQRSGGLIAAYYLADVVNVIADPATREATAAGPARAVAEPVTRYPRSLHWGRISLDRDCGVNHPGFMWYTSEVRA